MWKVTCKLRPKKKKTIYTIYITYTACAQFILENPNKRGRTRSDRAWKALQDWNAYDETVASQKQFFL